MARTEVLDDPSVVAVEAVAEVLGTNLRAGLSSAEASHRLREDGANELRAAPPVPTWRKILAQFQDPLIYLLLGAVVISLVAWVFEGRPGWPVDAIVIAAVVVLNAALGYVQQAKAESAVAALQQMTAITAAVIRDGQVIRVPADELVRGDLLVLSEGEAVGADGRLCQAAALKIQESSLTGESEAVQRRRSLCPPRPRLVINAEWCSKARPSCRGPARPSSQQPEWTPRWVPLPRCWKRRRRSPLHPRKK